MTASRDGVEPRVTPRAGVDREAIERQLDTLKLQLRYSSTPSRRSRIMAEITKLRQRLGATPCA